MSIRNRNSLVLHNFQPTVFYPKRRAYSSGAAIRNRGLPFLRSCYLMFKNSRFPLIPFRYSAHVLSPILLPRRLPNGKLRRLYPPSGLPVACYQRKSVYELMEAYILRTRHYFSACTFPITCNEIALMQFSIPQRITFDSLRKRKF